MSSAHRNGSKKVVGQHKPSSADKLANDEANIHRNNNNNNNNSIDTVNADPASLLDQAEQFRKTLQRAALRDAQRSSLVAQHIEFVELSMQMTAQSLAQRLKAEEATDGSWMVFGFLVAFEP